MEEAALTNKGFIRRLLKLVLPMMLQSAISEFVNMLDNIMVGRVGTVEMTGVTIANQMFLIFNMVIIGAVAGIGIYEAQFAGKNDTDGIRYSLRFKLMVTVGAAILFIIIMAFMGSDFMGLYLKGEGAPGEAAQTLGYAMNYMSIMLIGIIPFSLSGAYAGTLKQIGKTVPPMVAGLCAVFVNLILNYILIYGKFGAPVLGVAGAAIATVISRFVELAILVIYIQKNKNTNEYAIGLYKSFKVPSDICRNLIKTGFPLIVNEVLWALAFTFVAQCYSIRGLHVVAAYNIVNTFWNVFSVAYVSSGIGVGIMMGHFLGSGRIAEARKYSRLAIVISFFVGVVMGIVFLCLSRIIPDFYNTTPDVKALATEFIVVCSVIMPIEAVVFSCYFTMRSGGQILRTFLFDGVYMWAIMIPLAYYFCHFTELGIVGVYWITQGVTLIKAAVGTFFVLRGTWIKDLVENINTTGN